MKTESFAKWDPLRVLRKYLLVLLVALCLCSGTAQDLYVGAGVDVSSYLLLGFLLQVGGEVREPFVLRGSLSSLLIVNTIGVDVLYKDRLSATTEYYLGGGPDLFINAFDLSGSSFTFGVHGTVGIEIEYAPGAVSWFGELQPTYFFSPVEFNRIALKLRSGFNFPIF